VDQRPLLELTQIDKSFGQVKVLHDVRFDLRAGEVHALMGENGAGKSTLMKILSGFHRMDRGQILLDGQPVEIRDPHHALQLGIATIYQELNLVPTLSVAENIFLGREPRKGTLGVIDWRRMQRDAREVLNQFGLSINPAARVDSLRVAEQQMVEIAKALSINARVLIMDEPTSALTQREIDLLFTCIHNLRAKGVAIVYISHKLDEVFALSDRITVLRDGRWVATQPTADLDAAGVIRLMVGRNLSEMYPKRAVPLRETVLSVRQLSRKGVLHDISFDLRAGEIVGVAGLMGAGKTELAMALFGGTPADSGEVRIEGKLAAISNPAAAIARGISLVPEDRKMQGVLQHMSVQSNITLASLNRLRIGPLIDSGKEKSAVRTAIDRFRIKVSHPGQVVSGLSGGNQQKVALSKWLVDQPKVLMMDEPTRGIDVGAKSEIYRLMVEMAEQGLGILIFSSELPELLGMCDRILVLHQGHLAADLGRDEATQELILTAAMGGNRSA